MKVVTKILLGYKCFYGPTKDTGVTVPVEITENKIMYSIITSYNYIWSRNIAIKNNGRNKTDCFGKKNPTENLWSTVK